MTIEPTDTLNKDIVLFALYELGGARRPVHTEEVAHRVFQYPIGKQRYRWERYGMYPDKERIARELRRLKNWKGQSYVRGHVNIGARKDRIDGWMLTAPGVERVKKMEKRLTTTLATEMGTHSVYEAEDIRKRIVKTACYRVYQKDTSLGSAKDHHFTDMLYCLPDASSDKIRSGFDALLAGAKAVEAAEIVEFLEAAAVRFRNLLDN